MRTAFVLGESTLGSIDPAMKVLIGLALFLTAEIGIRVTCGVMTPLPAVFAAALAR